MKYRPDKNGTMISQLGYGCMRFTKKGPNIDFAKAEREVMRAIESGVNYFDTAYLYPGSEACLGETQCPQKIKIRTELKKTDRHLRPLPFKAAIGVVRAIKKRM